MSGATLFDPNPEAVADTSDVRAAGLVFDLDVAAPVDPARRTCPAQRYLTP